MKRKRINVTIKNFFGLILSLNILFLLCGDLHSQDVDSNVDFSDAIDAEEKRSKWGTEEHKQSLIDGLSQIEQNCFFYANFQKDEEGNKHLEVIRQG